MTSKKQLKRPVRIVRGEHFEAWRQQQGLVVLAAAEAFGIQRARWDQMVKDNEVVTDRRLLRIFFLFEKYPQSQPNPHIDYAELYRYLGFSDDSPEDHNQFAQLLGISRSSSYRILQGNSAGRSIDAWVAAIQRMGLDEPATWKFVMSEVGLIADESMDAGIHEPDKA
jgi:plasmid maintenance system antidote protein VapI